MVTINYKWIIILTTILGVNLPVFVNSYADDEIPTEVIKIPKSTLIIPNTEPDTSAVEGVIDSYMKKWIEKNPNKSEEEFDTKKVKVLDYYLENRRSLDGYSEETLVKAPLNIEVKIPENPVKKPKRLIIPITNKQKFSDSELEEEVAYHIVYLIVKEGDTLSDIARRNYNDPNMYVPIFMENKDKLDSPHMIPVGVELRVPKINNTMNREYKDLFRKFTIEYQKKKELEKENRNRKKNEQEKTKRRKEEAENKKRRKEEAENRKRRKEEAEDRKRRKEEAEDRKRRKEEAEDRNNKRMNPSSSPVNNKFLLEISDEDVKKLIESSSTKK